MSISVPWLPRLLCLRPLLLPLLLCLLRLLPLLLCLLRLLPLLLPLLLRLLRLLPAAQQVVAEAAAILTQIHQVGKAVHLLWSRQTDKPAQWVQLPTEQSGGHAGPNTGRTKHRQVMCTQASLQAGSEQGADFPGRPARCSRPHRLTSARLLAGSPALTVGMMRRGRSARTQSLRQAAGGMAEQAGRRACLPVGSN